MEGTRRTLYFVAVVSGIIFLESLIRILFTSNESGIQFMRLFAPLALVIWALISIYLIKKKEK